MATELSSDEKRKALAVISDLQKEEAAYIFNDPVDW
jgi:hypothetical protein